MVSVVMSVHNDGPYVAHAVQSILDQTFRDFEFLIYDDGSTDDTPAILARFQDPRLHIHRTPRNEGISSQVNRGLDAARGHYIARMDGDDLAEPGRFARQVAFMEENPRVGICGSQVLRFSEKGTSHVWAFPLNHCDVQAQLFFRGSFCNPSTILRREVLEAYHLRYDPTFPQAEDYLLWYRLLQVSEGANLPEVLLRYRLSASQVTQARQEEKISCHKRLMQLMLRDLGFSGSQAEAQFNWQVLREPWPRHPDFFRRAVDWLNRLHNANRERRLYDPECFDRYLREHCVWHCRAATGRGLPGRRFLREAAFVPSSSWGLQLTLFAKSVLRP